MSFGCGWGHNGFGPFERFRFGIVGLDVSVNGAAHLGRRGEAGPLERVTAELAEPDFDLVEPGSMGRGVVEVNILVSLQPTVVLGLMGIEVVQDDVNLLVTVLGDHLIHECEKFHPPAALGVAGLHLAGRNVQGGKQGGGAMAFVLMRTSRDRAAIGQLQPALSAFQSLYGRLLIHGEHNCVLRRMQVNADHVRRFGRKIRIGTDAPRTPSLQRNAMAPEYLPDILPIHIAQGPGQQGPIPLRVSWRWRLVQQSQNPGLGLRSIAAHVSRPGRIDKAVDPRSAKAPAPLANRGWPALQPYRDLLPGHAIRREKNHTGPKYLALLRPRGAHSGLQNPSFICAQVDRFGSHRNQDLSPYVQHE